jgi:small-conductance mechanosensitive channel
MPQRLLHLVLVLLLLSGAASALAQAELLGAAEAGDAQPAADTGGVQPEATDDLETTDQAVKVEGEVSDTDIAGRLREIFESSGRYTNLQVRVDNGIVFIDGTTSETSFKQWATELTRRTQDVIAVVNNLEVVAPPVAEQYDFRDPLLELWDSFLRALPLLLLGSVLLAASFGVAWVVTRLIVGPVAWLTESRLLQNVIRKVVGLLIVVGGLVLFLRVANLTGVAVTVVSGTGLIGLIVGFAFRDIAENFLASILLSVQTPFRLGDVIEVTGYTGVVQKVTPRGTVLIDFDGNHIQIANSTVYKSTLKNLTANPKMRQSFDIGVGYDASVKQTQDIILQTLREQEAILQDPEPMVLVDSLGASTINVKVYFWIDGHKHSVLKTRSAVMRRVLRAVEQSGISLPDEAREIIFPQGVPFQPADTGGFAGGGTDPTRPDPADDPGDPGDPGDNDQATEAEGDLTS